MVSYPQVSAINNVTCKLGEGPVWDEVNQCLRWIDTLEGNIYSYGVETSDIKTYHVDSQIGSISLRHDGGLIIAASKGFALLDDDDIELQWVVDPEIDLPNNRFNDGKCDPIGRFFAGTMDVDSRVDSGALYSLNQDKLVTRHLTNVWCSNGLAWNSTGNIFYYIDTLTQQVWEFDYDLQRGVMANKRVIIEIPKEEGLPDGMTIDVEGNLWIAIWDGAQIQKWNPSKRERLARIMLPVARPTSCTFGGERLTDLFITTASLGLSEKQLAKQPLAGKTLIIKNAGQGLPVHRYKN